MAAEKVVLVGLGERKRPITFVSSDDPSEEKESLLNAIKDVFDDVLRAEEKDHLVISVKSDQWNGEYVELHGDRVVENSSCVCLSQTSELEVII